MIAVISPAKNLDFVTESPVDRYTSPLFPDRSELLINKLKKLSAGKIARLMSINDELANLNFSRYQSWHKDYKGVDIKQAIWAFNGDVYRALNAASLSRKEIDFAQRHLIILSGLHGVLRPLDAIQPYRLEMGTKLTMGRSVKNLYDFWKADIADCINDLIEDHPEKVLVNLASNEYFKAIDANRIKARVLNCQFLDWKNGEFRAVMTWAKLARGAMAGIIIREGIDDPEDLKSVSFNNYSLNRDFSSANELVFTRRQMP